MVNLVYFWTKSSFSSVTELNLNFVQTDLAGSLVRVSPYDVDRVFQQVESTKAATRDSVAVRYEHFGHVSRVIFESAEFSDER